MTARRGGPDASARFRPTRCARSVRGRRPGQGMRGAWANTAWTSAYARSEPLETRQVFARMRLVVDARSLEIHVGDHRPQCLAQAAGRLHRLEGAAQVAPHLALEISLEQARILGRTEI